MFAGVDDNRNDFVKLYLHHKLHECVSIRSNKTVVIAEVNLVLAAGGFMVHLSTQQ